MRALRLILGEALIEIGAALRLIGWRLIPDHHPTVTSNGNHPAPPAFDGFVYTGPARMRGLR